MTERPAARRGFPVRMVLSVALIVLVIGAIFIFINRQASAASQERDYSLIHPRRAPLVATVSASGVIAPNRMIDLNFSTTGTVMEILVTEGQQVAAGEPLARLDTRDLELRLEDARAAVVQAEASYEQLVAGASEAEVAQVRAQLDQARSNLRQVLGNVTEADVRAARAQLEQAQALLARLESGPRSTDVTSSQAQLDQARANLESQRDTLSAAKTRAESQLAQTANQLRDAQASYEQIYWDNRRLEDQLARISQELPEQNRRAEDQALRAVRNAEESMRQAELALENARQAEINGLTAAQAQVDAAQANLDRLLAGSDADQLASARAQVAQAQAQLNRLVGESRQGSLAAAQAQVDAAQASLDRLLNGSSEPERRSAQARIQSARAALGQAELALERAVLVAPFAGTVARINLEVGQSTQQLGTQPAIRLADLSSYHVDVTVDEIDIARLQLTQPVTLTVDALSGLQLPGEVTEIAALSNPQSTVPSYEVRISLSNNDTRVKPGMSTTADIVVDRRENVLLVPRRAVRADRGRFYVDTPEDATLCQANATTLPVRRPPVQAIEVTTGLSNELAIEITGGLDETTCVYVPGIDARLSFFQSGGPPPGVQERNQTR